MHKHKNMIQISMFIIAVWSVPLLSAHNSASNKSTVPETKIAEFANSVDLDEVAHNEPPHLVLHCLPPGLSILSTI